MIGRMVQQGGPGGQSPAPQMMQQPGDEPDTPGAPDEPDPAGMGSGQGEQQPNVTPEEQAQYDQFVKNGLSMIYPDGQDKIAPAVLDNLQGNFDRDEAGMLGEAEPPLGKSPNDALAGTTVLLVLALDGSANDAGHQIDDDVVMHAGIALLEELAEVSGAAGIHDYSEQEMEAATYRAMDLFRVSSPRVDQEQLKAQFGEIQQADKDGTLDKLLPGIGSRMQQGQGEPAAQPQQPPQPPQQPPARG